MEEKSDTLQNMSSAKVGYFPLVLARQDLTASEITGYSKFNKDVSKDNEQQPY